MTKPIPIPGIELIQTWKETMDGGFHVGSYIPPRTSFFDKTPVELRACTTTWPKNPLPVKSVHKSARSQSPAMTADAPDDANAARQAGWTDPHAFDYEAFTGTGGNDKTEWHGSAARYEWTGEMGEVAPRVPELEKQLFSGEFILRHGAHLENLVYDVKVEGPVKIDRIESFATAGLHPVVMENIELLQYNKPTTIQSYVIPAINMGMDIVAISQTGSGKTAAYLIPIMSKLMGKAKTLAAPRGHPGVPMTAEPLVVVVVPTRELAIQIFDQARQMCYRSMLRPCVAYGGMPPKLTIEELGKGCDVLIATPGRLCDLMDKPHVLTMSRVKFTVIDEADEMLHSDWEEELKKIMAGGDSNEDADHTFMMFSATFPRAERELAREYLASDYTRIRVGRAGSAHKNIRQDVIEVAPDLKREACYDLLMTMDPPGRTLIFCNSRLAVDLLDDYLYNRSMPTTSIHSGRNQREREDSLRNFRDATTPILIATGVSGRGWDVMGVIHVINFDLPSTMHGGIHEYVHRIGRTGRIGHKGLATSFYDPNRNEDIAQDLVNILVESECEVPPFLQHLTPEPGKISFDDDTDHEGDDGSNELGNEDNGVALTDNEAFLPTEGNGSKADDESRVGDNAFGAGNNTFTADDAYSW